MAQSRDRRRTVSTNLIATGVSHVASSFPPIAPPRGPSYRGPSAGLSSVTAGRPRTEDALFPPLRSRRKLLLDIEPRRRDRAKAQGRTRSIGRSRGRVGGRKRRKEGGVRRDIQGAGVTVGGCSGGGRGLAPIRRTIASRTTTRCAICALSADDSRPRQEEIAVGGSP